MKNKRQIFLFIFLLIVALNLIEGIVDSVRSGEWAPVIGQLTVLAIVAFIGYRSRDTIARTREEYRRRFETSQEKPSVKDAALFSLAWSREIYQSIPEDRKQLVKQAFVLIGIGMAVTLVKIGFDDFLTVLIIAALILAGVNLLVWVFSTERGEKDHLRIELETARQMQLSLMPTTDPPVPGFDISGCCVPARNVGGDMFDYTWIGRQRKRFGIAVVDVAGKGMDAAMTAVFTSGAFISEVQQDPDIAVVMRNLNAAVRSRNNRTRFVSFLLVAIDVDTRTAHFVNAGQSKPLLLRNGSVRSLENPGAHFPLGLVEDAEYSAASVALERGDSLLLFTDGVSEAMNPRREVYGEERLRSTFAGMCGDGLTSKEIVDRLRDEIAGHALDAEQHDDLTIVVARAM